MTPDNWNAPPRRREENNSTTSRSASTEKPASLNDLKAKVIASINRSRDENSSTPVKGTATTHKANGGLIEPSGRPNSSQQNETLQAPLVRKDSGKAIDDLLAEGKAAAEAGGRLQQDEGRTNGQRSARSKENKVDQVDAHRKDHIAKEAQNKQRNKSTNDDEDARQNANHSNRESSAELGEIIDDQENASATSQQKPKESVTGERTRLHAGPSANNGAYVHSGKTELNTGEVKRPANQVDMKVSSVTAGEKRFSEVERPRKESVAYETQDIVASGRRYTSSDESSQPRGGRFLPSGRSARNYGELEGFPQEAHKARPSKRLEKDLSVRREPVSRRVVEIDDVDDLRNLPSTRVPRDYKEASSRQYPEEQPHKVAIYLSQAHWTELQDWLEMTGYHDQVYRKEALQRHKELVALDIKRAALAQQAQAAQEEQAYIARAQSVQPREVLGSGIPRSGALSRSVRSSSIYDMPPPPLPAREDREVLRRIDRDDLEAAANFRSKSSLVPATAYRDDEITRARYVEAPARYSESGTTKRRRFSDNEDIERGPSEKLVRVDSHGRAVARVNDEVLHRPLRSYSGTEERRVRGMDGIPDRHLAEEYPEAKDNLEVNRRPRELVYRGRADSPLANATRDRARSLSPLPRTTAVKAEFKPYRREEAEEDRYKFFKTDPAVKTPGLHSPDESPARKAQGEGDSLSNSRHAYFRQDFRDNNNNNNYEKRFTNDTRGGYQQRPDYNYQQYPQSMRGRGRGRGGFYHHRGDGRVYNHNQRFIEQEMVKQSLDLPRGGQ